MTKLSAPPTTISPDRVVDNRVYTSPDVYDAEVARIFERTWSFVCHESEIPESGDFATTTLAAHTPVIINRDSDGRVRAFCNTCRHRGSIVVAAERGHCSAFRCPYHFWVYSLDGSLASLPGEDAYDGTGFCKEDFALVALRCESLFGMVFVNLDDDAVSLADWLGGEIIDVLRRPFEGNELEVVAQHVDLTPVNWKVFAENARDGYHVPFVHPFFRAASPPGTYHLHRHGHAVQHLGMDPDGIEPDQWAKLRQHPFPGVDVGEGYIITIFPDLAITLRSNVLSIDFQRLDGPTRSSLANRTLGLVGDSPEVREIRTISQQIWFTDPVRAEDYPIFELQQRGVASRKVTSSVIARGKDALTGTRGDDNRLRHFWVKWREMMGVSLNSLDWDRAPASQSDTRIST